MRSNSHSSAFDTSRWGKALEDVFQEIAKTFTGCHAQGDTEEETIENIKDAILGCLEVLNQRAQVHDSTEKIVEVALA